MYQMVSYLRATASVLNDDRLTPKMRAWATIIEQFLERDPIPENESVPYHSG
jgi:hypothetical protein